MKPKASRNVPSTQPLLPTKPSKKAKAVKMDAPAKQPTRSRKRKSVEEDAGSRKKQKVKVLRTKEGALTDPVVGRTDPKATAVVPLLKYRPTRVAVSPGPTQEDAVESNVMPNELKDLLTIGDRELFNPAANGDVLLVTSLRYSFKEKVKPLAPKDAKQGRAKGLDTIGTPITNIYEAFDAFAKKSLELGLQEALPSYGLRIATMCSGTEAPLLAMDLMKQAMKRQGTKKSLDFAHVFSVEIEPSKQAYIERNFKPPLLFRDVTEFQQPGDVHTAYGGTAPQPQNIQILVAGSSCVDYSALNSKKKKWGDEGQSRSTLMGIRAYVERHRPKILILENVKTAPWPDVKKFFARIGYVSQFVFVDTKNFLLPQTRERGYLIGFDQHYLEDQFDIDKALDRWVYYMHSYQQRANAPFTDFICDDDDPRLHEARFASEAADPALRTMDWAACRHRYARFRIEKHYGSSRPMTHWQNNGSCLFPDFGWIKWAKLQRERIWDTLEVQYLRHAGERDYDINFKARWFELSQNVDRDSDTKQWGIVACLTPSGIPYLTTRGGPVSGFESLILQGIPTEHLNLTKETPRQLQDLAGNAMSVTVVNAAILSSILAVHDGMKIPGQNFFGEFLKHDKLENNENTAAAAATASASRPPGDLMKNTEASKGVPIQVGSLITPNILRILNDASRTLRFCKCEGTFSTKQGPFQLCMDCGHMTCKTCGHNPAHKYTDIAEAITRSRGSPAEFMKMITETLPTALRFNTTDASKLTSRLNPLLTADPSFEANYRKATTLAFQATLTMQHIKRGHSWKITFEGPDARLELRITRKCSLSAVSEGDFFGRDAVDYYWLLFAKPPKMEWKLDGRDSDLRIALQQPIARMVPDKTLLSGNWETIRFTSVNLDITSANEQKVASWESNMGLQVDMFRGLKRHAVLHVDVSPMETNAAQEVAKAVTGDYILRPDCGGASASMHVRYQTENEAKPLMFFFLDPEQLKNAVYDCFVFSTTNYRAGYKEYRPVQAKVQEGWRPTGLRQVSETWESNHTSIQNVAASSSSVTVQSSLKAKKSQPAKGITKKKLPLYSVHPKFPNATFQDWVSCESLSLGVCETMTMHKLIMPSTLHVSISENTECRVDLPLLVVELPIDSYEGSDWNPGTQYSIPLVDQKEALRQYGWLLERAAAQMLKTVKGHQQVAMGILHTSSCSTCAPEAPSVGYAYDHKGDSLKAIEDGNEATKHERALKQRPPPITAIMHCYESSAALDIRLNIPTLCHRVLAKMCFSQHMPLQSAALQWSMAEDHGREKTPKFKVKAFLNNDNETASVQPANFYRILWPEQARVLTWMVRQETEPCEWHEQEREEVCVPALGCRIDVEARAPKQIRGGVLADEVGGGKTTTSLALVAKMLEIDSGRQPPQDGRSISVDATLILVPAGLIPQWKEEADDCFRRATGGRRLVITNDPKPGKGEIDVHKLKVSHLREKDIVFAPWNLFDGDEYWNALERLCGIRNKLPKSARAFRGWLHEALEALAKLTEKSAVGETHASLLHAVTWRRIVIDEYSILEDRSFLAVLALKSLSRWLLSGTPPTSSFDAVNATAKLLKTKLTSEDEEEEGSFKFVTKGTRLVKDRTSAEQFHWYRDNRSPAWLRARNKLVDGFIEKFVRKNSPEAAKNIAKVAHYEVSVLSAHEHITYCEVFQRLMGQTFKFKSKPTPSKDFKAMKRSERIDEVVATSLHAEDALLSCCSELNKIYRTEEITLSADAMCTPVIQDATDTIAALIRELWDILRKSFGYEKTRVPEEEDIYKNAHFYSYKLRIMYNDLGDKFASELIDRLMAIACDSSTRPTSPYKQRGGKKPAPVTQESKAEHSEEEPAHKESETEQNEEESTNEESETEQSEEESTHSDLEETESVSAHKSLTGKQRFAAFQASMKSRRPSMTANGLPISTATKSLLKPQVSYLRSELKLRSEEMKARSEDLNMISIEIIAQMRIRRVFDDIQRLLRGRQLPQCSGCREKGQNLTELFIFGICGHIACRTCLKNKDLRKHDPNGCLDKLCSGPGHRHNLIEAAPFAPTQMSSTTANGSKMDAVVSKVKEILQAPAPRPETKLKPDAILIFVQFLRVKSALIKALTAARIHYENASTGGKGAIKKVDDFRKGKGGPDGYGARVLVLDVDSADAAGWNLQRANHVMFVSAYFAPSQSEYDATMTQAIGRAHRYNQKKPVHVYHFLMAKTIEVNIIQNRNKKALIKQDDGTFQLEERTDSEPTAWEGPDMQGAASGAGAVDLAEVDN